MCDRDNRENTTEAHIFHSDQLTASLPREPVSWSMGDHNNLRNQTHMQNSNQEMSRTMQYMQDMVSNLEYSLQSVTAELRSIIHKFTQGHEINDTQALP